jgi:hypothetical protein
VSGLFTVIEYRESGTGDNRKGEGGRRRKKKGGRRKEEGAQQEDYVIKMTGRYLA